LAFDLTQHSVIGPADVLKNLVTFRRLFRRLFRLALARQPDVIIGVDYGAFNLRFARAIRRHVRRRQDWFHPWNPKLVQYVSPQVWASRPGRARQMEQTHDLVLCIFPFEPAWYARHAPRLRVAFVGHPMVGRLATADVLVGTSAGALPEDRVAGAAETAPTVLFLPGSRLDEVRRHWSVVTGAFALLRREVPKLRGHVVLPDNGLVRAAEPLGVPAGLEVRAGNVAAELRGADLAITKSGTVTLECALCGVPAVVFYKTSWPTYWAAKRLVQVKYIAMPNLLAGEPLFPEFVQGAATAPNLARAALDLLRDDARRRAIKSKLREILPTLGGPGANARAAEAIVGLLC